MKVEVGHFTKETSGTANATQQVTLVDSGLTPQALILWCTSLTAAGFGADSAWSYGMGSGTATANQIVTGMWSDDAAATSDCFTSGASVDGVLNIVAGNTVVVFGRINAFAAGSFTLIYPTNNTTAYIIHYLVIGNITNE